MLFAAPGPKTKLMHEILHEAKRGAEAAVIAVECVHLHVFFVVLITSFPAVSVSKLKPLL